mmetsp:Transcript_34796/g.61160  ORF Transcript_34796/g.61160 Transcript_34796/m.61160 type:complete len:96 (-) Transcript_34796:91-378(-)
MLSREIERLQNAFTEHQQISSENTHNDPKGLLPSSQYPQQAAARSYHMQGKQLCLGYPIRQTLRQNIAMQHNLSAGGYLLLGGLPKLAIEWKSYQ